MLDVQARRLDSPLDSFLSVMNAQGGVLAENDDFVDPDYPLVLHHADSRLVFTFPAAGDYILRIRDTQGKGGDEYAYRLVIAPPKPDCVLRIVPDMQRVAKGDSVAVTVAADRRDGFGGEINLAVQNLPPGFAASDAVIPAGQPQAKLTITAPPDAPLNVVRADDRRHGHAQQPAVHAHGLRRGRRHAGVQLPARGADQGVRGGGDRDVAVQPVDRRAAQDGLEVKQGAEVQVVIKAARKDGAKFPINLAVVDAPAGIAVKTGPHPRRQERSADHADRPRSRPPPAGRST